MRGREDEAARSERVVHEGVPYEAQFASRALVGDILAGRLRAEDDPRWRASGAATPEEYALWAWNCCGMACLRMVLASRATLAGDATPPPPLVALARGCADYGGYVVAGDEVAGLHYAPFVRFVGETFGLAARVAAPLALDEALDELARGRYVIASVSPGIREPHGTPPTRGGHLVLLVGYDRRAGVLLLHNPSGITPAQQEYAPVAFDDFARFFAGRGIVLG